ncbi:MAG TPA: O-antigen ligase family protein [Solirubrobacteraceae bacterium]|nr:O-antigen ligase family protein [Solirubrobacteraceae bacterium]
MSAWPAQPNRPTAWHPAVGATGGFARLNPRGSRRTALWIGGLICILVAEGFAISHSYMWGAPLAAILFIAVATDLPIVPFLGVTLFVRVVTDNTGSANSHHSSSLGLAGVIAALIILAAIGPLVRRQGGARPALLALLWLCVWTGVAVHTNGASTETIREGVREASVVALAVLVYNTRGGVSVPTATRLVQFIGVVPACLALYQFATHTGLDIAGQIRANGTFVHPNSAAIFFAVAATVSLWRFLDNGRRRSDALLTVLFAAALIATFSIGGLLSLFVMLITLGALRPGSIRAKLGAVAVASFLILAFLATPLGAERLAQESKSNVVSAERGEPNSSFAWRLNRWQALLPEWEQSPLLGQGLGTTVTAEATLSDRLAGKLPHNEYLRYLVETGIVGVATILCGLGVLIRALVRRRRIPGTLAAGTLNAATLALAVVAGCLFDALADNVFTTSITGYAAGLIVASVLTIPAVDARRRTAARVAALPAT